MSAAIYRNLEGVILRYDIDTWRPHDEQKPQVSDRERIAILQADRELVALEIIFEHLDLSSIALTRIADALSIIRRALSFKRSSLGMQVNSEFA